MLTSGSTGDDAWADTFSRCHKLAMSLLDDMPDSPAGCNDQVSCAHLCRLAIEASKATRSQASDRTALDVQQPCTDELELLIAPITALLNRLRELLDQWPENPLLEQLTAICNRLLGMRHTCCPVCVLESAQKVLCCHHLQKTRGTSLYKGCGLDRISRAYDDKESPH